ncbi:purine-uracil permease NCS1-like [Lotus japonicus]|uniref:purine-uracil permease NCS1-like n=1 Tax=Lotus japonicus TaxID=34305 RepID=UPI0025867A6B|nr:purine-uracil permease NCS1-like [Lotus japonicus]
MVTITSISTSPVNMASKCLTLHHLLPHSTTPFLTSKTPFPHYSSTHLCNRFPTKHLLMKCSNSPTPTPSPPPNSTFSPDPTLTNQELNPTSPTQRTFSGLEIASLWVGLVVGVPSYYLAGSLVDLGMAWWQGIATVIAGNIILLFPLILTGHPGTRYGISFPVLARSSFGIHGAHIPTLLRALVGCGWYGIESWIGGDAIFLLLPKSITEISFSKSLPWLGTSPLEFSCFMVFWVLQLAIVWRGIDGIRQLEKFAAPILIALTSCLLIWSYVNAGGFTHMLALSSRLSNSEFWAVFFPALTANISFWITVAINIPDFTRYAKSQKDQVIGQIGLPIFMGAFTFVGLAVTSSTKVIFGEVISNPIQLLGRIGGFGTTILAILGISLATVTTNIAANVVAPANALVNLNPAWFTFRRGAILTALLGIAFQPWRLLKSSESFVYTWLVGYSALMGPIGGIVLADYYLIQKMNLSIKDLYSRSSNGVYYYSRGFNVAAIVALVVGILPVVPGFLQNVGMATSVPNAFVVIYNNAWFISFFSAGFLYWVLSSLRGKPDKTSAGDPLLPVAE